MKLTEDMTKLPGDTIELLTDRLRLHARTTPDRLVYTFLRDDGKVDEITFGQLERRASNLARALAERAPAGSRALLLYPAGLEFIVVYLACLLAGIIAVPATIPHKCRASRRLKALLEDADPVLILTRLTAKPRSGPACRWSTPTTALPHHRYARAPDPDAALPQVAPEDLAFLQYTSGSTALPKGVEITHRNIASNVASIRAGFGFTPETRDGQLAAAVPRHGPDRQRGVAAARRFPLRADGAGDFPEKSPAVAAKPSRATAAPAPAPPTSAGITAPTDRRRCQARARPRPA